MPIRESLDDISSPKVRALAEYWQARKASGQIPLRNAFEPNDLRRLLPHILIVDITEDPFTVRYRLIGTKVVEVSRIDFTGKLLEECEFQADDPTIWMKSYKSVLANKAPVFGCVTIPLDGDAGHRGRDRQDGRDGQDGPGGLLNEFGIFPLSHDGTMIHQCIAIEDFKPIDRYVPPERVRPMRIRVSSLSDH